MIREAYRFLLWLHPGEFEERFGEEMLWIFDLRHGSETGISLLLDGGISVCRQWLACPPVRTFAMGFLVNGALALCSAACAWSTARTP